MITEKEESLRSARGMLRSIAVIAVRQENNKTVLNIPFGLSRAQELIDDDLSTVDEVTELCFP